MVIPDEIENDYQEDEFEESKASIPQELSPPNEGEQ